MKPVYMRGVAYALGGLHPINELPELKAHPETLQDLLAVGLESYARAECSSAELLAESLRRTLAISQVDPSTIDAVVCAHNNFRDGERSALALKRALRDVGLGSAYPFGMTLSACGNLHSALRVAALLIGTGEARRVVVATTDKNSEFEPESRIYSANVTVYSDGAASCVLDAEAGDFELAGVHQRCDAAASDFGQAGTLLELLKHTAAGISATCRELLQRSGIEATAIDRVFINNYNRSVQRIFATQIGTPRSKLFDANIARFAHAYAADNLINLADAMALDGIEQGRHVLLLGTGPETWGGCVLRAAVAQPAVSRPIVEKRNLS